MRRLVSKPVKKKKKCLTELGEIVKTLQKTYF